EDMVSFAGALVLNIGTLTPYWVDSMLKAGKKANEKHVPIILDPVGSGATSLRTASARRLIDELDISVIRGNASEVLSLAREGSQTKGVDSVHSVDQARNVAVILAQELNTVIAITGKVDLVTDGKTVYRIYNGHEMMGMVTGTGCTATVIVAAFLSVDDNPLEAAATGLAYFGLAGELAAEQAKTPGSYQIALLDALYTIKSDRLKKSARILAE
ncbi:MAG: hydroxyethylthiazole kinase, partial [Candidatus Aminicenantes bacterium]|nr:hydroxyethylthiazole kinase [Candidatus Aminicenantes bacterium]